MILCASAALTITFSTTVLADGTKTLNGTTTSLKTEDRVENYISGIYSQIDFGNNDHLSYEVFNKAFKGYLNLKEAGKLNTDRAILTVCDFSTASTEKRMWIIDLNRKKVLFNTYVAHGQGSGEDGALTFSNRENTHKSSLGFYVTADTYKGSHGTSLRIQGMDQGFNDAAYERGVVVHGSAYVNDKRACTGRLGRSWGCPAVPQNLSLPIINTIKDGTCLFIYYPERKYMATSQWLNKQINNVPTQDLFASVVTTPHAQPNVRIIQYMTDSRIDSIKTVPLSVK